MSSSSSSSSSTFALSETYVDFVAGWASGAMAVIFCQPVDTVLTRMQAGQSLVVGSVQTRGMVADYGMTALWRGSSAMISAVPMQNCLLMGGYGIGKQWSYSINNSNNNKDNAASGTSNTNTKTLTLLSVFVGGCTGGIVQSFLMSPVELMKVNQQVIGKTAKAAGMEVIQGLTSPKKSWRGLNATLLRDGIPHGVWFASYEWCKTAMMEQQIFQKDTTGEQVTVPLISGAFAATVAWAVGYPFDTIKTRIQASNPKTYNKGIYSTGVDLVNEANGRVIAGLYRGFGLKLVRAVPASMIGFTTYELVAAQLR